MPIAWTGRAVTSPFLERSLSFLAVATPLQATPAVDGAELEMGTKFWKISLPKKKTTRTSVGGGTWRFV